MIQVIMLSFFGLILGIALTQSIWVACMWGLGFPYILFSMFQLKKSFVFTVAIVPFYVVIPISIYFKEKIDLAELVVFIPFVVWLMSTGQRKRRLVAGSVSLSIVILLGLSLVSLAAAPLLAQGILAWSRLILYFILFYLTASLTQNKVDIGVILNTIILVGVLSAFYAFYQWAFGVEEVLFSQFLAPQRDLVPNVQFSIQRVSSIAGYCNMYATYLIMVIPLTFSSVLYYHVKGDRRLSAMLLIAVVVLLLALFSTLTRGAIVSSIVSLLFVALMLKKKRLVLLLLAAFTFTGCLLFLYFPWEVLVNRFQDFEPSFNSRIDMWAFILNIFQEHPLIGIGPGQLWHLYQLNGENLWFCLLAELGLLGTLTFAIHFVLLMAKCIKISALSYQETGKFVAAGIAGSIVAIVLDSLVDPTLMASKQNLLMFGVLAGLIEAVDRIYEKKLMPRNDRHILLR